MLSKISFQKALHLDTCLWALAFGLRPLGSGLWEFWGDFQKRNSPNFSKKARIFPFFGAPNVIKSQRRL
jgi:hypothetical protein